MKFELLILGVTWFLVMNTYNDGKYFAKLISWKKYYKMAFICFSSLCFYLFIKKEPKKSQQFAKHTADFIKYLPIDRQTSGLLNPILDFTMKQNGGGGNEERIIRSGGHMTQPNNMHANNMHANNMHANNMPIRKKRSVSETKKKYVASKQNWNCGHCKNQLSAWFEVDHIMSLENGGTNEVNNLVALCRECHGEKTAMEHL